MKIYSVSDQAFREYGRVFGGMEESRLEILGVLQNMRLPEHVEYVPEEPQLQQLKAAEEISTHCFGGLKAQLGWCNGHNTKLNCLEYHRSSEFNLGSEDFILLLAKQSDIEDGILDTQKVRAFQVPAGILVEVYATTLHYAPCQVSIERGFKVMVALPQGTNLAKPAMSAEGGDDAMLWAANKWLLAHAESAEAQQGAFIGLRGENIDIKDEIMRMSASGEE
jgi:hypothetical protein